MLSLAAAIPAAAAQSTATAPGPGVTSGLLQATLGLAIVLALIWGAAWIVRRISPATRTVSSAIKVVATQNVGPRERVVLVEIGSQWLVVGVAPGRVSALHTCPKSVLPADGPAPNPFGRLLARAKGGPGA
ncbi:MAG: flagellar biosynthetic protein FliO [Betaproteobacteria bacterium]|nr:flagellar biosynthetic protein FliO [Betaproteobacteria bacterium]MBK7590146.1 flagellar biosynthetic protein FliO [Betaproteobacteria bacterium]